MSHFVHESSYVDDDVSIGDGTKVWHFSHIQSGVQIGSNCSLGQNVNISNNVKIGNGVKIQNNVSVFEGVELEDYVFCGPSMVFTNDLTPRSKYPKGRKGYEKTIVRYGATIGANATIVCGNTIGKWAMIASGAVVTEDVPDFLCGQVYLQNRLVGSVNVASHLRIERTVYIVEKNILLFLVCFKKIE